MEAAAIALALGIDALGLLFGVMEGQMAVVRVGGLVGRSGDIVVCGLLGRRVTSAVFAAAARARGTVAAEHVVWGFLVV